MSARQDVKERVQEQEGAAAGAATAQPDRPAAGDAAALDGEALEAATDEMPTHPAAAGAASGPAAASDPAAASGPAATSGPSGDAVGDDLAALQEQADQLQEKLLRARADYDNLQRRVARDAEIERERVKARFLEDFLQVFEYSAMAVAEAQKQQGPLAEGVKMVHREFGRLLEKEGVQAFGAVGDAFDARLHEAVATEPEEGLEPGAVARVVRPGYRLGERVLRYAKVAVAAPRDPAD